MGGILDMGKIEMTDEYVRVGTTLYKTLIPQHYYKIFFLST